MEVIKKNKNISITVGVIVLIVIIGFIVTGGFGSKEASNEDEKESILPQVEVIPTVDDSVEVELDPIIAGKQVKIIVTNYPEGTEVISFRLTYTALVNGKEIPRGPSGIMVLDDETMTAENKREVHFGTKSKQHTTYDEVVGDVTVEITFEGDYGTQTLTKDFSEY